MINLDDQLTRRGPGRPRKNNDNNSDNYSELNIFGKIKYLLNNYFSKLNGKYLIIFLIIGIIIIFPIGIFVGRKTYIIDDYTSTQYSYISKISHLRKTWQKYRNLKPYELHIKWLEFLKNYTYVSGGDPLMNQADCLRAWLLFMKAQGANIEVATIPVLASKFQDLGRHGYIKLNGQPKIGDVIIFRPINGVAHIGIVESQNGIYIKYMDFSPLGVGFPICQRGDWRVHMIVDMNFLIWAGDVLKD